MKSTMSFRVDIAPLRALLLLMAMIQTATALAEQPEFSLHDLDGSERSLSEFRGRWVVVNYWATWCRPCVAEMPELEDFHRTYEAGGAAVLGVNLEAVDTDQVRAFVDSLSVPITYPILMAGETPPPGMPSIVGLPTTLIVSPDGDIVAIELGVMTKDYLAEIIGQNGGELLAGQ